MESLDLGDLISNTKDPDEHFELLTTLGVGSYGKVFKALHKSSGMIVAIKIVPTSIKGNPDEVEGFPWLS